MKRLGKVNQLDLRLASQKSGVYLFPFQVSDYTVGDLDARDWMICHEALNLRYFGFKY